MALHTTGYEHFCSASVCRVLRCIFTRGLLTPRGVFTKQIKMSTLYNHKPHHWSYNAQAVTDFVPYVVRNGNRAHSQPPRPTLPNPVSAARLLTGLTRNQCFRLGRSCRGLMRVVKLPGVGLVMAPEPEHRVLLLRRTRRRITLQVGPFGTAGTTPLSRIAIAR